MLRLLSLLLSIVLLLAIGAAVSAQEDVSDQGVKLWLGGHSTDYDGYTKKVGEYKKGNDEFLPEGKIHYWRWQDDSRLDLNVQYFDDDNVLGRFNYNLADKFSTEINFRSMIRQTGQDLLENIAAREWLSTVPGGKMLTHEILDPGADYNYTRSEISSQFNLLLSRQNDLRLLVSHRSIIKKGEEQQIASDHCFSCHLTSQGATVNRQTHSVEAGLEGKAGKYDLGLKVGMRTFKSHADAPTAYYDNAAHPVTGGATDEFGSRVLYDDTTAAYSVFPEKRKIWQKFRVKGDIGKTRFVGSFGHSKTRNKTANLDANSINGALSTTTRLSKSSRLVGRLTAYRVTSDNPLIDLPDYREGAADSATFDFDFIRYSSLDRLNGEASIELITRLDKSTTLSLLAGYDRIDRYDFFGPGDNATTNKFSGQANLKYLAGRQFSQKIKYRWEKTSDPFTSARGLFEADGSKLLEPLTDIGSAGFQFQYFQREDLRYQKITTEATDRHEIDIVTTFRPSLKTSINTGIKGYYEFNDDLDSLDVERFSIRPNLGINYSPSQKAIFTVGYTYSFIKNRGPVTIALFDG